MPAVIRVLIVDDSALIRQMLTRALSMDPRVEIVGTARNGVEAIEKARQLSPDVVTLDIEMPELTGLEALPHLRKLTDARVVMLSSLDDPDTTYRALSLGAVDFIPKPSAGMASSITELTETLLKTIKTANRIDPGVAQAVIDAPVPDAAHEPMGRMPAGVELGSVVAIAASTGGPPALERVFSGLSPALPAAYLIVQHLPPGFSASLARRLSSVGDIHVSEATDGEIVEPGRGYIASHGRHMQIETAGGAPRIRLTAEEPRHGVRPAADLLFDSVAHSFGCRSVGVVLTGMGSDGAKGALAIREAGGEVVAQNEETSVVWGMPGATLRAGAVHRPVAIALVAAEIRRSVRAQVERGVVS